MSYLNIHIAIYTYLSGSCVHGPLHMATFLGNVSLIIIRGLS